MCPKHSDAKQTEMMGFGAEKGLLQGHARRWVAQALKSLKLLGFSKVAEGSCFPGYLIRLYKILALTYTE